jgi:hypothetical protein
VPKQYEAGARRAACGNPCPTTPIPARRTRDRGRPPDVCVAGQEQVAPREAGQVAQSQQQRQVRPQGYGAEGEEHGGGAQHEAHVGRGADGGEKDLA